MNKKGERLWVLEKKEKKKITPRQKTFDGRGFGEGLALLVEKAWASRSRKKRVLTSPPTYRPLAPNLLKTRKTIFYHPIVQEILLTG